MRRCKVCGNQIPAWSGWVCPVCGRDSPVEKRYWPGGIKRVRRRHRPDAKGGVNYPQARHPVRPKASPASSGREQGTSPTKTLIKQCRGRRRLDGFNRLLCEVYARPVHLSHVLIRHGVSRAQVEQWRSDGIWLVLFLRRLRRNLLIVLLGALPGKDRRVLDWWYGLDGLGTRSAEKIAAELGMGVTEVQGIQVTLLEYLQGDDGRAILECAIVTAASETKKSREEPH